MFLMSTLCQTCEWQWDPLGETILYSCEQIYYLNSNYILRYHQRYYHFEISLDAHLVPRLSSTLALNKIKRLYNHASGDIVMIATRKDSVWKCLVLLYEIDFNIKNTDMRNVNKKLMLHNGKAQFKKKVLIWLS